MVTANASSAREKMTETPAAQLSALAEAVETVREEAIALAREKTAVQRDVDPSSLLGHPHFMDTFKYGMAISVANLLAKHDPDAQAVYAYDPDLNTDIESGEQLPVDPMVHLLVLVTQPSAALETFVNSLDRALSASLKKLRSPMFAQREFILDVNLITEQEVKLRQGYGGILSALFAPPLKVWQREA